MGNARRVINKANSLIGVKEGPEADKKVIDPWNKKTGCHATSRKNPWCAIFAASVFIQSGNTVSGYSLSSTCKGQKTYYKNHKRWTEKGQRPRSGDVVFMTGHEGVITSNSYTGKCTYVSGNSGNAVRKSTFNWKTCKAANGKKIQGYGRPKY